MDRKLDGGPEVTAGSRSTEKQPRQVSGPIKPQSGISLRSPAQTAGAFFSVGVVAFREFLIQINELSVSGGLCRVRSLSPELVIDASGQVHTALLEEFLELIDRVGK